MSSLGIEGCHVFITGATGEIGGAAAKEFLVNGCSVTAFDNQSLDTALLSIAEEERSRIHSVVGNSSDEHSLAQAFKEATEKLGAPQILIIHVGTTGNGSHRRPIWEMDAAEWDRANSMQTRSIFLTTKHFLLAIQKAQESTGEELENISIVITVSKTDIFGQGGCASYAYELAKSVGHDIVKLNSKARINVVAPASTKTPNLSASREESETTAGSSDVARCMSFLASHRAAGHITGQCIPVDDACLLWRSGESSVQAVNLRGVHQLTARFGTSRPRRMRICITIDFDALSGYLGTGHMPENTLSDYSAGIFSANVGVDRLLKVFKKYGISQHVTWFIPGHSMESFPRQTLDIVNSGAEIGLHGYSHEGAYAMNVQQERDVLEKCIELASNLPGGKRPVGYRAPLYQIRESTINLLQEHGMLYDSSMNHYDSVPYLLTRPYPEEIPHIPDYTQPASTWMVPFFPPGQPAPGSKEAASAIVEIPGSWYTEDLTPMGFYPYTASTQGYVSVDVVEKMWLDRFNWLWEQECWLESDSDWGTVYPLILHPECSGRSHIVGMLDHFLGELTAKMRQVGQGEITFETMQSVAKSWKERPQLNR